MTTKMLKVKVGKYAIAAYEAVAGAILLGAGVASAAWWTTLAGLVMLALAGATAFGRGEATSWLRGDFDERRLHAVDHGFKVGFFVLAWWVAAIAAYGSHHEINAALVGAGNGIAILAAYFAYGLRLRRS